MPRKKKTENIPVYLDIGCGSNKCTTDNKGNPRVYIGVDIAKACNPDVVFDVRKTPWPWKDESVDGIHTSHFLEHLTGEERISFFNEAYRVLKSGAEVACITPAPFTHRYMQDPTHKFPMIVQEFYNYLHEPSRKSMGLEHYPITCNFEWKGMFSENPESMAGRNDEYKQFHAKHSINTLWDLNIVLTKI